MTANIGHVYTGENKCKTNSAFKHILGLARQYQVGKPRLTNAGNYVTIKGNAGYLQKLQVLDETIGKSECMP